MTLSADSRQWFDELQEFIERRRRRQPLPDLEQLPARVDEQRRISGGALIDLFEFIKGDSIVEVFPSLGPGSLASRAFVLATDRPGMAAAQHLVDRDSDRALVVLKEEWRDWVSATSTDSDEAFDCHWEVWNVWHQTMEDAWELPDVEEGDFWVHEEGFALADRVGRSSKHLWLWRDSQMSLQEEEIDKWVSRRGES